MLQDVLHAQDGRCQGCTGLFVSFGGHKALQRCLHQLAVLLGAWNVPLQPETCQTTQPVP